MTATTPNDAPAPHTPTVTRSARAMVWARRGAAARDFWSQFRRNPAGMVGLAVLLVIVLLALLAPVLAPERMLDVTQLLDNPRYAPPSAAHPFGTDHQGREIWVRMLWGARVSLIVGFAATAMSMVIGTIIGISAGHFSGWAGGLLMRVVDFFLVLPSLILAIVLAAVLSRGVTTIVIAIGITSWAGTARVVRSQTLSIESRDYVERARVLGAGHWHIIVKHLLPAVMPLVLANTTLTVGSAIISESTLSFLGLGDTTKQSWGTILKNSMDVSAATSGYWWYVLIPGLAILLVVMAFTLVGRAVEGIVNPTLRSR
ncbi:ABC transporter permease [Acidipropionibacterium virtanenii]|uniref:Dipeptide transport system permease protein DppC n=1 Tax=Acidipropionibacterium virtanenii TaxID=2057246 RepID=A0A344URC9_9ACTN|nr:Dipeptide transport system permease protein DppC [Acidipropionibacterium virtanenii]